MSVGSWPQTLPAQQEQHNSISRLPDYHNMADPNWHICPRDSSGHFTQIGGEATPVLQGPPIQVTNTGSISANPFTQPIKENPVRVEQRAAVFNLPTML